MNLKRLAATALVAAGASAAFAPFAFAHAVVSAFAPQGAALTGARTSYVLRVPNERADRATFRISMAVPEPVQTAVSVLQLPGWTIKLTRKDTGQKNAEGTPIMATTAITWIAPKGLELQPGFYTELFFRFQNPISPQKLCFPTLQYYGGKLDAKGKASGTGELVSWTGAADSPTPASCVDIVAKV